MASGELDEAVLYTAHVVPATRRPTRILYSESSHHYATLLPASPLKDSQLPTPLHYYRLYEGEITALREAYQLETPDWRADPSALSDQATPLTSRASSSSKTIHPPRRLLPPSPASSAPPPPSPASISSSALTAWPRWAKLHPLSPELLPTVLQSSSIFSAGLNKRILLIRGDITKLKVGAVVNAANKKLLGGGGIDKAIHDAAGKKLMEACRSLGGCDTGEAKTTSAFNLPCKHVIHAVGPDYRDFPQREAEAAVLLRRTYLSALREAKIHSATSMAFPCISTGIFRFPRDEAALIAAGAVREFLETTADTKVLSTHLLLSISSHPHNPSLF